MPSGSETTISTRAAPRCDVCGADGALLYEHLHDRSANVPGDWRLLACDPCRYVWLDPRPTLEDVPKLYDQGYSIRHSAPPPQRLRAVREGLMAAALSRLGYDIPKPGAIFRLGARLPFVFERVGFGVMFLRGEAKGRVLDVGCGVGRISQELRALGWEVVGIEPDPNAAATAREAGLTVHTGTLEEVHLPSDGFDAAVMNHVVEHLIDPLGGLRAIHAVLKPRGRLVLVTPNLDSLAHRLFKKSWYALDPPRHIRVYTLEALDALMRSAGFDIAYRRTSGRGARRSAMISSKVRRTGRAFDPGQRASRTAHVVGIGMQFIEELLWRRGRLGEEIVMIGTKRA